ncbi:hypothetical protein GWI33_007032 [Rhynchophorus ferrugineus]|uniref:Cytochrome P450 n=1 Tax=Rhynchophorus ferrugineus TaxID=354439 RepID=A0A834MGX5_RHYFE|nr:hypothetical protein GWI33_007032 [Rhynchophorus ferrugineus]
MIVIILVLSVIVLILWSIWSKHHIRKKYFQNVPGPKPVPIFGNTLDLIAGPKVFLKTISGWMDIFGETILVHDGPLSVLLMTMDYDLTQFIYNSSDHIDKGYQYTYLHGWLGNGLLTSTGLHWKLHRKAITPSFHFSILKSFVPIFERISDKFIDKLNAEVDKDSVEISKLVSVYTLNVICEAAMGLQITDKDETHLKYINSIRNISNIISCRFVSPLHPELYPFTWNYFKEIRLLKFIHNFIDNYIGKKKEKLKTYINNEPEVKETLTESKEKLVFLDHLIKTTINGRPLSDIELRDEVNTFMFEGHDTTSSAISFCLYNLSLHSSVQEKVLQEQKSLFGADLKKATPTYNQLNEMKYLEMVIKESLRLFPSVPLVARRLSSDLNYNGTVYPKGLNVLLYTYGIHRNPKYYTDPDRFIPERFESNNGRLPFSYLPFSAGLRNCIGQRFAMLELLSVISKVIRNFELKPANPFHEVELSAELVLISVNGIKISLSRRK